jgi:acetyl-CoA carboxylase carboxyltransferase component
MTSASNAPSAQDRTAVKVSNAASQAEGGHTDLMARLIEKREQIRQGGGQARIEAQHAKGKMTARERILKLLDDGTFHEIDSYITHRHSEFGMADQRLPGDSVIIGFGKINGRRVCLAAQDFTILGGSFSEVQGQKVAKIMDLAMEAGVPMISLNDSVGARIQEGVYSLAGVCGAFLAQYAGQRRNPPDQRYAWPLCRGFGVFACTHRFRHYDGGHQPHVYYRPRCH